MKQHALKIQNQLRRKQRIRKTVAGTTSRPRLSVYISNMHVSAQIINDESQQTIVAATTIGAKDAKGSLTDKAIWVGTEIGRKAKKAKIPCVVLDRNGKLYHGRIKALADAARAEGLEF
jgi:large subunit ribosomal protein L18